MQFLKIVTLILLSIIIISFGGCRSTQEILQIGEAADANPGPCPRAFALYDASRIVEFLDNTETFSNVGFTGEFQKVRSLCRYYGDKPIEGDLEMDISFGRGPASDAKATVQYEYFVAVTRKNIGVINKKTFPIQVKFPSGENRVTVTERINKITIPRAKAGTSGENFEIIVGFVLTPEQREFNTQGKRFRVSVGQG